MATLISTLPKFVSPEEHRTLVGQTPTSFADIPSVLRHKEDQVKVSLDPPLPGLTDEDCAEGSLYIIESALVYLARTGRGFQIEYPHITLHAVSRSDTGPASIYCQLEDPIADMEAAAAAVDDDDNDGDLSLRELSIIPKDDASLDPIFEALSLCASLHPDPPSDSDPEEGGDDDDAFIDPDILLNGKFETFTGTEEEELSEVGRAALAHLESIIDNPFEPKPEALEDANEDDPNRKKHRK